MNRILFALLAAVALAGPAPAQQWRQLSPQDRSKAVRNFHRHNQVPEERRKEAERQYQRWQEMTPEERERLQSNYQRYRSLPLEERREFDRKFQNWKDKGKK